MTKPELKSYEIALAGLTENTAVIRTATIEESDWAMVANHLRSIEVDLATKRREIEAEATHVAQTQLAAEPEASLPVYESDRGNLVPRTKRSYSFNDSGILLGVMGAGVMGIGEALAVLKKANALTLTWRISGLENIADRYGMELRRARREIEDGDPEFLVGVVSTVRMERA